MFSDLQAVKDRFGGFTFLDLTQYDLQTAHWHLGVHVSQQVQKILAMRLDQLEPSKCCRLIQQARICENTLTARLADQHLDKSLRTAVQEYMDCLAAWARGAGLADFTHPVLKSYQPMSLMNLALFLQHDSAGCQTGMYRQANGSVILWHSEEDIEDEIGNRFDQLRLATFNVGNIDHPVRMHAFIYPDLLPGPAFGWREDGYAQAVDTLHTRKAAGQEAGMLANIATWLTLRLGPGCDPRRVVEDMSPYFDGYALNVVRNRDGKVKAEKYEFAENHVLAGFLGDLPGDYLFQVNIFSRNSPAWVKEVEYLDPEDHELYRERERVTRENLLSKDHRAGDADDMRFFFEMMTDCTGSIWSYANIHVKAYFILRQTMHGIELWYSHGPALRSDQVRVIQARLA
jgi:hypothetical protein